MANETLEYTEAKAKWKHGFRWCDNCNCACASFSCLKDDVCSQIVAGYTNGSAEFALKAEALNKSLRK